MPKFSESEKEIIKDKLLVEGEHLFTMYGLKKVTVDDLIKATGIAKGSFYVFYTNKEHLYMDILGKLQEKLWSKTNEFLKTNETLSPKELTKKLILWSLEEMKKNPMLMQVNNELTEYLYRKLPKEIIDEHTKSDSKELEKLKEYGVTFKYNIDITTKIFQMIAIMSFDLLQDEDENQNTIIDIILNGIINEIVSDDK